MHLLRLFIGSILFIFILITGISLFFPSRVRISKAMNVLAPRQNIEALIADMGRWPEWNPFLDSVVVADMEFKTEGMNIEGANKQETSIRWIKRQEGEWVAETQSETGRPVTNGWQIIQYPDSDSTTIQWYMDFKLRWYPWEKFSSLLLEKSYGPQMEEGLNRLRQSIYDDRPSNN